MKKLDLRLFRFMKEMKGQVIATCCVILVGIILYTALNSTAINLSNTLNEYYEETNFPHMFVDIVKIPENKIKDLEKINGIDKIEGRIIKEVPLKVERNEKNANIRLVTIDENKSLNKVYLTEGRFIEAEREVIVLDKFAKDRNIKLGDDLKVQLGGKGYTLKVSGIAYSPEYIYLMENEQSLLPPEGKFGVVFCKEDFLQNSIGYNNQYNSLLIKIKDEKDMDIIKDILEDKLDKFGLKRITERKNQLSHKMVSDEIKQLKKTSNTVPVIFLGISALIISVIIGRMVAQDRMTIGILKSMGFSNYDVLIHYTKYAFIIGAVASIIGSVAGLMLAGALTNMYTAYFNLPLLTSNVYYRYIVLGFFLTSGVTIGAGLMGARKAIKILPSEAMRPEAPKVGKRILLERVTLFWSKLSFSWKVVVRNIFRNKKRFLTVTMGVAITYMVTLFPFYQLSLFNSMFVDHYGGFQRMDYNINFTEPLNKRAIVDLNNIIEADIIEGKIEYPFEIENGWKSKVVNIIGVKYNTKFYNFETLEQVKTHLPRDGIVLSENLASYLNVSIGDKVLVKNFIPYKDDVEIEVRQIIKQGLGINAYMDISEMERILVDKNMVTGAYVKTDVPIKEEIEDGKKVNSVESIQDLIDTTKKFMKLTLSSVGTLVVFAGILGFGIIYNATIMNISERTREFSTLQILGFTKTDIFKMILKETIIMTILGITIGIPLGIKMVEGVVASFNTELYTMNPYVSGKIHLITMGTTIIFIVISLIFTLKKINKLDLMEALKTRVS
ncbi:ABC transporter permease [Anaeromicrobium sediminis]|nr:ABC transporter permease [Anaeromicrobium sediminis]